MTNKEIMQMALDIMESAIKAGDWVVDGACDPDWVLNALRAALAQPEPEPVAWTVSGLITDFSRDCSAYQTKTYTRPLYTAPPQREWQGLTDEEIREGNRESWVTTQAWESAVWWAEAKLKEKNT